MSPNPYRCLTSSAAEFWLGAAARKTALIEARAPSAPSLDQIQDQFNRVTTELATFTIKTLQGEVRRAQVSEYGALYNLFTGKTVPEGYDFDAHTRSFLYELSPSSCQFWRKNGKWRREVGYRPVGVVPVNVALGEKNCRRGWMVGCSGGSGGLWTMERAEDQVNGFPYHGLPSAGERVSGRVGRRRPKDRNQEE